MNNDSINLEEVIIYAYLGFEMQLIYTFRMVGQLYNDLNAYVEKGLVDDLERIHQARQWNLKLYTFCKKFNSHYNMDLIVHLLCYQLYLLFMLFKLAKRIVTNIEINK